MGHGIFPNYGMTYVKSWMNALSNKEKKEVFFPSKKSKANTKKYNSEEEESVPSKRKKR
jgi:hypothetical protein